MEETKTHSISQEEAFTQYSIPRVLLKFVVPSILSQLVFLILNLADAFFVGRTGDTYQISAMTITFPVSMLMMFISNIFGVGANANMASELGKGNREKAKQYSAFAIYTASVIVIIYSFVLLSVESSVLHLLGADENSFGHCRAYLLWVLHWGCVPMILTQVFSQLFMAEGESQIAAFGIAGAGIINIILDPVFIFPLNMGVAGAGLATCMANCSATIFYLVNFWRKRKITVVCIDPRHYRAGNGICGKVLAVGVPSGLVLLFTSTCDFFRNYYLGALGGQVALAAWGVVQKIGNAFMQIGIGIAQGIRAVLAFNYSSGLYKRSKDIIKGAIVVMGAFIIVCISLVECFPSVLVHLFIPGGESAEVAAGYLQTWIFCLIGIGFIELFNSVFQAIGRWKISMANTIINKGLLLTPVMVLLVQYMKIPGIIISQPITENLTAIVLAVIYVAVMRKMPQEKQ